MNGQIHPTNKAACEELQLLENDAHWDLTLADASQTSTANQIRTLFAILLTACFPSNPEQLWEKYKDSMSEDLLHTVRVSTGNQQLEFTADIYNAALALIEDICLHVANEPLIRLGMPSPNRAVSDLEICSANNHLMLMN